MGEEHTPSVENSKEDTMCLDQDVSGIVEDTQVLTQEGLKELLLSDVPANVETDLEKVDPDITEKKIKRQNQQASGMYKHTAYSILYNFIDIESKRAQNQNPLRITISIFTGIQLVFLNIIIAALICFIFFVPSEIDLTLLFDLLKFYIGSTVVELLGMLYFLTKATFSSSHVKLLGQLIGKMEDKQIVDVSEDDESDI